MRIKWLLVFLSLAISCCDDILSIVGNIEAQNDVTKHLEVCEVHLDEKLCYLRNIFKQ